MKNPSMKRPIRTAKLHALLVPTDALTTSLATTALLHIKKPPGFGE
jgi:hypothetical protein